MDLMANTKSQLEMTRSVHDLGGINKLRSAAKSGDKGALEEAAKQFEAIFVQMLLKSMRKGQEALADKDSPFNSEQVKFYRNMHDQQMATDMSTSGSIGLAEIIIQQMGTDNGVMPASAVRSNGDLSILNRSQVMLRQGAEDAVFGTQAPGTSNNKRAAFDSPKDFVESLYPQALEAAKELNIDPKALLAQAAVETGWGKFVIHQGNGDSSHNLFGIKADKRWEGEKAVVDTLEYINQVPEKQQAAFRSYQDFGGSLNDYVAFIQGNPRYSQAIEETHSPAKYFNALQEAGYATDPVYADKVMSVYKGDLLNDTLKDLLDGVSKSTSEASVNASNNDNVDNMNNIARASTGDVLSQFSGTSTAPAGE
jgi:flagellar protein FlgJ